LVVWDRSAVQKIHEWRLTNLTQGACDEVLRYDAATPAVRMEKAAAKACAPIARQFKRGR